MFSHLLPLQQRSVLFLVLVFSFSLSSAQRYRWTTTINPNDVTIARDNYGVPHIFGKTDADVAYGLAWANAEDAFNVMQELILTSKGMMGRYKGKDGAAIDYVMNSIGCKRTVKDKMATDLSADYLRYLEGYCQGLNAYAKAHPDEVWVKAAFPVVPADMLQGFMISLTALSFSHREIEGVLKGKYDSVNVFKDKPYGSNAFAFNSTLTADGKTYLCINPHMDIEGPLSFYEAHLCSEEGLNIHGATFHGCPSIFMATNEYLGWGMTYDDWDLTDVYQLRMHPRKKRWYAYDGQWKKLEKRPFWITVKLGKIKLPVKLHTWWSEYGATYRTKNKKFFSVRFGANMTVRAGEQIYRMNKARNLDEFKTALRIHALPRFNMVYADRYDQIFYIDNGMVPERNGGYNWNKILPGDTSATLWKTFHPVDSMPQVENPECGYVFNTNNTPFNTSCNEDKPDGTNLHRYPENMGYIRDDNNRSQRFMELVNSQSKFTFDDFKQIKYDKHLPRQSKFLETLKPIFTIDHYTHQRIVDIIGFIQFWDRNADSASVGAALFKKTVSLIFEKKHYGYENFFKGAPVSEGLVDTCMWEAKLFFLENYQKLDVKLGETQWLVRGDKEVPLQGFPDVLSATYTEPYKNGREKAMVTDAYTQFVVFGPNGPERLETLVPFGSSHKPGSEHYTSQMELFSRQQPKPMSLHKDTVLQKAVKIYHPQP